MNHDYIMHYGTKRHSGRYPWGSGQHPYQDEPWFKGWSELRAEGKSYKEIAEEFGMTIKELKYRYSYAKDATKAANIAHAKELRYTRQMSPKAIADKMGVSESTINAWLKPDMEEQVRQTRDLADKLAERTNMNKDIKCIDVGKGVSNILGTTPTKLEAALTVLKDEGYLIVKKPVPNPNNITKNTEMMFLYSPPDEWKNLSEEEKIKKAYRDISVNLDKIEPPCDVRVDENNKTTIGIEPPKSISSKRVMIDWNDSRDGLISIKRGVPDLYMGENRYNQVRIGVDGTHYLKGMAVYADPEEFPPGIDIIAHTPKSNEKYVMMSPDDKAKQFLKPMKKDPDGKVDMEDPFGAQIMKGGQIHYTDEHGKEQLGLINKVNEQGVWSDWTSARTLASQVLSKQDPKLAERQLELQRTKMAEQFEEIQRISNPVVRRKELIEFAEECDKAAVHMKAASLPGQSVCVILPGQTLKEDECYAPGYKDGDKLACIRFPHEGKFAIPILTVNNRNRECRKMISTDVQDAICMNPKAAERLSGADFDGDTVVVIPNNKGVIKSAPQLKSLEGFDGKAMYPGYTGMPVISHNKQQTEMGIVTNLITDMNLIGADPDEMARAVKYSQVIIDAEKHKLNWKACKEEMRIAELQKKYQDKGNGKYGGSGTIVSKASGEEHVPEKVWQGKIDPETGEKVWRYTEKRKTVDPETGSWKWYGPTHPKYDPQGELKTIESTKMAEAKDAMSLVSPAKYQTELVYANFANQMKDMANKARLASTKVEDTPYDERAAETYAKEVESLKEKVNTAKVNAVLERRAARVTTIIVNDRMKNYPERYNNKDADGKAHLRKLRKQVMDQQRAILNKAESFPITEREWEAIQAGALKKTFLSDVLNRANQESVKQHAFPKETNYNVMTDASIARAKAMLNSGFTQAEVAELFGISTTTLRKQINK